MKGFATAAAVAALAFGLGATQAQALPVGATIGVADGDPGFIVGFEDAGFGLGATFTWNLDGVTSQGGENVFRFVIDVENRSSEADINRISSFSWGNVPQALSVALVDGGGVYNNVAISGDGFQAGMQGFTLQACVIAGPNCQGGAGGGLPSGGDATVTVDIATAGDSLFFADFATRWQALEGGESTSLGAATIAPIPLPPVAWMLLGAIGALAVAGRRRVLRQG